MGRCKDGKVKKHKKQYNYKKALFIYFQIHRNYNDSKMNKNFKDKRNKIIGIDKFKKITTIFARTWFHEDPYLAS